MEMGQYVNLSADSERNLSEGRDNCQSETGWSKVYKLVGVSFGLLCIIQSVLNVSLRLYTTDISTLPLGDSQPNITEPETGNTSLIISDQGCPRCPSGWRTYMSSCYWLSAERKNWMDAKEDCSSRGAHLLIVNDDVEGDILYVFGPERVWIGLSYQQQRWTWVDGSILLNPERRPRGNQRGNCVVAVQDSFVTFTSALCRESHSWVCEMELK
ncbi:natural killer cells antigen CD94-like isoform X2 [Stegastes partitus]|uniref:Natural killer cells antigen CD94-like n=1 Tax=Stegastes partitus TaxID=144197 RepID=A0A3B5BC62_9TELE|nr:PREDICTED: natural killer cells antigen CD94-like isoform X2 [Stegastes partitus]